MVFPLLICSPFRHSKDCPLIPQGFRPLSHRSQERHCHQFYCQTTMSLDTYLVGEVRLRQRMFPLDSCQESFRNIFPGVCAYYIGQDAYILYKTMSHLEDVKFINSSYSHLSALHFKTTTPKIHGRSPQHQGKIPIVMAT